MPKRARSWHASCFTLDMNLVMFSGGYARQNLALAQEVRSLLRGRKNPRVAFVPGDAYDADTDFRDFKRNLKGSGVKRFQCICVDRPLSADDEKALFSSDAIFIGGGNTFYILHHLRQGRLLAKLRAFVKNGGVLLGLSAGSILMTPNVETAQIPNIDPDDNDIGLTNFRALDLVNFEFSPHYQTSRKGDAELLAHSKKIDRPIYACADGEGIVVRDGRISFVGGVTVFHRGSKYAIQ